MSGGGFTLVDFTIPTREVPISHPGAQAPLCDECQSQDLCFFDPNCPTCQDILMDQKTSISELFAVMRQWVPQTQKNMTSLTREVLRRGANVNDRDDLTDLTLLHYACKSGAVGVGNEISAANLVKSLISKGANTEMRCRWTNMNAMHYAVFFDASEVVDALAEQTPSLVMGACSEFNNGNSLHIAAVNLSLDSAKILVKHEADGTLKDDNGHLPYECIPDSIGKDQMEVAEELRELLKSAAENPPPKSRLKQVSSLVRPSPSHSPTPPVITPSHKARNSALNSGSTPERRSPVHREAAPSPKGIATVKQSSRTQSPLVEEVTMASLGIKVGDRIIIDAASSKPKYGTIRYGGTTEFHSGQWAGVELDEEIGKNDGSYGGIRYFTCKTKYGLFVPMHRISKAVHQPHESRRRKGRGGETKSRDSMAATNKAINAQAQLQMNTELQVGDRVVVAGSRTGVLRFTGAVKFAPGFWLGVELDNSHGKNDGSVDGVRYFQCRPKYGIFVPPSKVKRHTGSQLSAPRSSASSSSTHTSASSGTGSAETTDSSSLPSSLVSSGASGSSDDALASSPSPRGSPRSPRRRGTPSSNKSSTPTSRTKHLKVPGVGTPSPTPLSLATAASPVLEEGMSVFANKEMGVVRFIGTTEFADGVWLGIELRKPNGKNDGSVKGKRYFTCWSNYGLFVRPEKATHRGINCSKLLQNKTESAKT